jgi:hypothetical protein
MLLPSMAGRILFGGMLCTTDYNDGKGAQILSYGVCTNPRCGFYNKRATPLRGCPFCLLYRIAPRLAAIIRTIVTVTPPAFIIRRSDAYNIIRDYFLPLPAK